MLGHVVRGGLGCTEFPALNSTDSVFPLERKKEKANTYRFQQVGLQLPKIFVVGKRLNERHWPRYYSDE
jgi:hypothetical protein